MPYRGTNSKRNVVHDKSRGTIREEARAHFNSEKKEHEHELHDARLEIEKLKNDGFVFKETEERHHKVYLYFINDKGIEKNIELAFPDNLSHLKTLLN